MTSSNPPQMPRLNKGRQKIEMKKITNERSLLVAFSKRYRGVFKKASELGTLCGVQIAIIVFSPTKKVCQFGHPSVQTILDRYLNQNRPESSRASQLMQQYRNNTIQELNMRLTNLLGQLEAAKKTGEELSQIRKSRQELFLCDAPIENLGAEELEKLKMAMLRLKKDVEKQALQEYIPSLVQHR